MSVQEFVRLYDKVPDKNEEDDCLTKGSLKDD